MQDLRMARFLFCILLISECLLQHKTEMRITDSMTQESGPSYSTAVGCWCVEGSKYSKQKGIYLFYLFIYLFVKRGVIRRYCSKLM